MTPFRSPFSPFRPIAGLLPVAGLLLAGQLLALSGCAGPPPRPPVLAQTVSPNGEPLAGGQLGWPGCDEALARWFARADTDHDGTLVSGEFLYDARTLFTRMDKDGDGLVTPAELQEYRLPFRPAPGESVTASGQPPAGTSAMGAPPGRRPGGGGPEGGQPGGGAPGQPPPGGSRQGGERQEPPDPVMMADLNLDFRVGRDEFLAHAKRTLERLDRDRDGKLVLGEVQAVCRDMR